MLTCLLIMQLSDHTRIHNYWYLTSTFSPSCLYNIHVYVLTSHCEDSRVSDSLSTSMFLYKQ